METNYQTGKKDEEPPSDYPPVLVRNITFARNRALRGMGATFDCSKHGECHNISVLDNSIAGATESNHAWVCNNVASYDVANNYPPGLEDCMANSLLEHTTVVAVATV
jgi:hypothetical protein